MRNMLSTLKLLIAAFAISLMMVGIAPMAHADGLGDAKAAGLVGEQLNGYLGIVSGSAGADVQSLVADINLRRKDSYRSIVDQTPGATLSAVEILAGQKLIGMTPAGQYVQSPSGGWVRK
ncbi:MAG: YdbL family protein [Parvibaculum sp.]